MQAVNGRLDTIEPSGAFGPPLPFRCCCCCCSSSESKAGLSPARHFFASLSRWAGRVAASRFFSSRSPHRVKSRCARIESVSGFCRRSHASRLVKSWASLLSTVAQIRIGVPFVFDLLWGCASSRQSAKRQTQVLLPKCLSSVPSSSPSDEHEEDSSLSSSPRQYFRYFTTYGKTFQVFGPVVYYTHLHSVFGVQERQRDRDFFAV